MATIVVFRYLKKAALIGFSFALCASLVSCPGEDMDCNDFGSITEVPGLFLLAPEQTSYTVGDELIFNLSIPANNDYYGSELNLYTQTGDESALLVLQFQDLFENNELTFLKGSQSDFPNWFNMPYDPSSGNYQLEIVITLINVGFYSSSSSGTVTVQGSDYCNRYFVDSNIPWNLTNGLIEFTVTE